MSERVIVVGAGPTGLALAYELALAGVHCTVLERRSEQPNITRAFAVHSRTLELLDARGLADELIAKGYRVEVAQLNTAVSVNLRRNPSRFAMMLIAPQSLTEKLLEARCVQLGVDIVRDSKVVGVRQDDDGVDVTVEGAAGVRTERAAYVVACDGAHSTVRSEVGVSFTGKEYITRITLGDVRVTDAPAVGTGQFNRHGVFLLVPFGDGYYRAIIWDRQRDNVPTDVPVTLDEMRDAARRIAGSDFGMHDPRWQSRFLSEQRQAKHYRVGRVLLAGDAAHTHSPLGGQGMNTGIGDAMNLGWKLAATMAGTAPDWLLDSYETERHPVGTMVLSLTNRLTRLALIKSDAALKLVQIMMRLILGIEAVQRRPRELVSGLGISYPPRGPKPHPLAGRRAPDLTGEGRRLYESLRTGRFVVVDATGDTGDTGIAESVGAGWADRVDVFRADPVARSPKLMLVRPDAYVAWATDHTGPGSATTDELRTALAQWCGPAIRDEARSTE